MKRKVSILIADHEPVVRFGIRQFLEGARADMLVCGEADSAPALRELCARHEPRVLVVDPGLSGGEGFTAMKEAPQWSAQVRIVAFTPLEDSESMIRAFRAGALAYITRRDPLAELLAGIDAALAGFEHVGPHAHHVFFSQMRSGRMGLDSGLTRGLSEREQQVFRLLGEGRSKKVIAEQLHLSTKTVDTHQQRIKDKLAIASCSELRQQAAVHFHRAAAGLCKPMNGSGSQRAKPAARGAREIRPR